MLDLIIQPSEMTVLGIFPQKSAYKIYQDDGWIAFCSSRNSDHVHLEGTYLPRTLSAHLKQETPFLQLNMFHEYLGHGSFCEHSRIGKKIVQYEQELAEIEKQILGANKLPENVRFKLDRLNPHFRDYAMLRQEFDDFARKNHNHYEGFAYWIEHYLAKIYGMSNLSDEKRKTINTDYIVLVSAFEDFVSKNSLSALLEKVGF